MARQPEEVGARRRIVVAIDAGAPGRAALEAAAALAAEQQAELLALFIEDLDLIHVAGLPFAREIGTASATPRALDVLAMERSLRAFAADARRSVETIARRVPLEWSFRVVRGALDAELLAAAAAADLVVEAFGGCERAALQLAEATRASERAKFLRARTRKDLEELKRQLRRPK
jgi:hypothetical protein